MTLREYIKECDLKPHLQNCQVGNLDMWLQRGELDETVKIIRIETEKAEVVKTPSGWVLVHYSDPAESYLYSSDEEADLAHPTLGLVKQDGVYGPPLAHAGV